MSRNNDISVNNIGNLKFDDIFGAKTRQTLVIPGTPLPHNVSSKVTISSGGVAAILPPSNSSYELFLRGDGAGGTLGFTSRVLCVKAYNNNTWSIKSETVNTEESMPSGTYPVTYTILPGSNNLVFNTPSAQTFDIQVKFNVVFSGSNGY